MTSSGRVVLGFLLVAVGTVVVSDLMVWRTSASIIETGHRHSTALESMLSLKGSIAEAVQESFAYLVSRDPVEKQDYLQRVAETRSILSRYAAARLITSSPTGLCGSAGTIGLTGSRLGINRRISWTAYVWAGSLSTITHSATGALWLVKPGRRIIRGGSWTDGSEPTKAARSR